MIEFMPRDGKHLPPPSIGDHVTLIGALVDDTQHSWDEIHPVWAISINGGSWSRSGPQYGGSPPQDRSYNAAEDCATPSGNACTGYGGARSRHAGTRRRSTLPSSGANSGGCAPGYSPCLPIVSDLNCSDIPADKKPVTVTGSDQYELDRDHNGIGCQSG